MADIYNLDFENFDFLQGGAQKAQQAAQAALVGDPSGLGNVVGATTQIVGFDSGGQPIPIGVQGDTNGVNLTFSGSTLTATLSRNIATLAAAASPALTPATIPLAKITGLGADGSITVNADGIITAYVLPT